VRCLGKLFWTLRVAIVVVGMTVWGMGAFSYAVRPEPLSQPKRSIIWGHISTMKKLIASFVIVAVCSVIVFLHCNAYAFSYEIKPFPFRLLKNDEILFSKISTYNKYENFTIDAQNNTDEKDKNDLRSNKDTLNNIQENPGMNRYLRATIETTALLGLVSLYYWGTKSFAADFDYDVSFETLKKKFSGKAILFDDNTLEENSFPGHPLAGAYYYLIPRNNGLSRTESFLWTFAISAIYEFFIELPEVASINDFVATPVAGFTIGESMYQFGRYFRCSENKDDLLYKAMAAIIDPIALINSFFWNDTHYTYSDSEICHYTSIQKDFNLFYGMRVNYQENTANSTLGFIFGFQGKLYFIPQYGKEGNIEKFFKEPILNEMKIEVGVTDKGLDNIYFLAKTVWAAYYRQNIAGDSAGKGTGYSFFAGLASAFEHIQYETGEFEDWIGAVHVFGPSMELAFFHKAGYVRLGLDVFGDFAMVKSYAFEKYKKNHRIDNIKSVLMEEDYYYAYGPYVNPRIEARYKSYRFFAEYKYAHYDSFEGRDRRKPSNDFHLADRREEYGFVMGRLIDFFDVPFLKTHPLWIEAEVRRIERSGFIADDQISHSGDNTWLLLRFKMTL
jgi:Domain of unknown function (DUF3943)